jgi:alanine racemase
LPVPSDHRQRQAIGSVVSVEAQLIQLRTVPAGESIGYGATYVAPSDRRVGILNIGYADGYLRQLGSCGRALKDGCSFPVIGRVSMDLIAADLTGQEGSGVAEGDWLTLDYRLPEIAAGSGLSQYELLTGLGQRYERRWS